MPNETYEVMQARLQKAFNLVAPKANWKARIDAWVSPSTLRIAGLTIEDVREAVVHFTATVPSIVCCPIPTDGFFVRATGYQAGPAGDH